MAHCSDADAALLEVSVTLTEELEDCLNSGLGPMMRGLGNGIAPTMRGLVTVCAVTVDFATGCSELASLANLCSLSSLSLCLLSAALFVKSELEANAQ